MHPALNPLALHDQIARHVLQGVVGAWAALELVIRARGGGPRNARDWTYLVGVAGAAAGIGVAVGLARVRATVLGGGWTPVVFGLALILSGAAFRLRSMLTLGRLFTFTISIQAEHAVVTRGPYRFVRHPGYAGWLVGLIGTGVALDNWLSLLAILVLPPLGVLVRIHEEEAMLERALGDDYRSYAARTRRLVPGVW